MKTCFFEIIEPRLLLSGLDVYVELGLQSQIQESLDVYTSDLQKEGYDVTVQEFNGTALQMRTQLQNRYNQGAIEGALFVGDLPTLMFTHDNDFDGSTVGFIHDLYFMDLDGTYVMQSGVDEHYAEGNADITPEIYMSRITTSSITGMMGLSEATLINNYFAKVHDYRVGNLIYRDKAILWSDDDWCWTASKMGNFYDDILVVNDKAETTENSYKDAMKTDAESILEMIHSTKTYHAISGIGGGNVFSSEVKAANPRQAYYNLWNCSSGNFTATNNLISTYVYSGDFVLNAVGSTKTGSMLNTQYFYNYQSEENSIGESFRLWFQNNANLSLNTYKSWHYGMTMQGDPTLVPATMGDGDSSSDPKPADFNNDGKIDVIDIDLLYNNMGTDLLKYDINNDNIINQLDMDELIQVRLNTYYGDANLDGIVDMKDYDILAYNWNSYVDSWGSGNFNGDGYVDIFDYDLLASGWLRGDFNIDYALNADDINILFDEQGSNEIHYDLNRDGIVSKLDIDILVIDILSTKYGDTNLDGKIDTIDANTIIDNWEKTDMSWEDGDSNGDGIVNVLDIETFTKPLKRNILKSVSSDIDDGKTNNGKKPPKK